jgi:ATP-dependent Clp protease ATP-binding subunit ClpA
MKASAEQQLSTSTEIVVREKKSRHPAVRHVGKHALQCEGFTPMETVTSNYSRLRLALESKLVDQQDAINAVIDALERSDTRLPNDKHPLANFAFLGPTGVGKSELAKVLSNFLADGAGNLIKIDCSNYSHGHEVASLIGSPPGFVGSDIKPVLGKDQVEKEGVVSVILFDEIEKGSEELYSMMLQIMGDGELNMAKGEVTSFRNTVVILTSNLGAKEMANKQSDTPLGFVARTKIVDKKDLDNTATKEFKRFFRPEFVNRLDELVVFHPLSAEGMSRVLDIKLSELNSEYEKHYGLRLSLTETSKNHLVAQAKKEPEYGARPLVRALQKEVLTIFGAGTQEVAPSQRVRIFAYSTYQRHRRITTIPATAPSYSRPNRTPLFKKRGRH